MTTTVQRIRDIIKCNKEVLGIETTKEILMNGYYKFPTENAETIERAFREAKKELRIAEETENRIKDEFRDIATMVAITSLVIGFVVGLLLFY